MTFDTMSQLFVFISEIIFSLLIITLSYILPFYEVTLKIKIFFVSLINKEYEFLH